MATMHDSPVISVITNLTRSVSRLRWIRASRTRTQMNRVESRKNRAPSPEKNHETTTASTAGQRVRDLVPHGPLTTTTRWRSSFILLIPLFVLPPPAPLRSPPRGFISARIARLLSRASAASYTGPPRRWRWLIVAPLSRDNEISVYAMRSPAGAILSLFLSPCLYSFDIPLCFDVGSAVCLHRDAICSLLGISKSLRKEP